MLKNLALKFKSLVQVGITWLWAKLGVCKIMMPWFSASACLKSLMIHVRLQTSVWEALASIVDSVDPHRSHTSSHETWCFIRTFKRCFMFELVSFKCCVAVHVPPTLQPLMFSLCFAVLETLQGMGGRETYICFRFCEHPLFSNSENQGWMREGL